MIAPIWIAPSWAAAEDAAIAPSRHIAQGAVVGVRQGAVDRFLGIPYAAPPVGALRFAAPQPHAPWATPLQATRPGAPCPQNAPTPMGHEDCLYLNIWAPAPAASRPRPVMVWFPGGGFTRGSASAPYYDGQFLAAQGGVVVVAVTYRVGALGFLTAPALDHENAAGVSGNYGLQDQQQALRWVQQNIAAFGGNARNVTIFGESAGGNSVQYQLASPLAKGLFAHAIIQSAAGGGLIPDLPLAASEAGGSAAVIAGVGCAGRADIAACLRALPEDAFLGQTGATLPVVDGRVLPRTPHEAFQSGQFNRVPTIIGSNQNEETALIWPLVAPPNGPLTASGLMARLQLLYGAKAALVQAEYPLAAYPSPIQALAVITTDSNFACTTAQNRAALARFVPVFGYQFDEPDPARGPLLGPPVPGLEYGVYHTADLPYVFGVSAPAGVPVIGKDLALSQRMIRYWTHFAVSGNPDNPAPTVPAWPGYRAGRLLVSLEDRIAPLPEARFSMQHHCGFWDGF